MVDLVPGTANKAVREVIDGREVFTPIVQADGGGGGGSTVDQGAPGADAWPVVGPITDAQLRATAVPVSGPLTNAQLVAITGTAEQTAVTTDPAAAGQTIAALLRGILTELQAQTVLLTDIKTNTTPTP